MSSERENYSEATIDQATELMRIVMLYMQAQGLDLLVTLVMAGRDTIRTAGNMNPQQQLAAFKVLSSRLAADPDIVVEIDEETGKVMSNATH